MAVQKQDDQHEHTSSSYVRIRDVVLKTYLGRWTIRRSGERGSGISVLPARYDDDDIYFWIHSYCRIVFIVYSYRRVLVKRQITLCKNIWSKQYSYTNGSRRKYVVRKCLLCSTKFVLMKKMLPKYTYLKSYLYIFDIRMHQRDLSFDNLRSLMRHTTNQLNELVFNTSILSCLIYSKLFFFLARA